MRMLLVYRCIVIGISNRCIDVLFTPMRGVVNTITFKKILVWCQRTWCYEWEEDGGGGKTRENNRAVHVTEMAYRARTLIRLKTPLVDSRRHGHRMPDANYFIDHCRKLTRYEKIQRTLKRWCTRARLNIETENPNVSQLWYPVISNSIKNQEELCIANRLPSTQ